MTRKQAIEFLLNNPVKFAHMVGLNKLSDLHNDWIMSMVRGKEDETLMAHRASYKTTCVSVSLAEIIILLPNYRTMFMRKTEKDVKEVIDQVQKILLDPHTLYLVQCIYGVNLKLDTQSATEISTNLTTDIRGTSQLLGIGIGGSLTGKHFDRIFTDDIINLDDRTSRAERERTKLVYQELQNIKNRGGKIYNTLTPWHPDDASTLMPPPKKYDCYATGIMTEEEIQDKKERMFASLFAANYELRHIASEDVIFPNPQTGADPTIIQQSNYSHIDAAYDGEDWTAFTIVKKTGGKYYVFGKTWRKHVDDCLDEIIRYRKAFNAGKIYCEKNADKGYLAKELRRRGERPSLYNEDMNKFLKITSYLKSEWKNVIFVAGTDDEYINMIKDFNDNAEHDDCPDSLASLIRILWNRKNEDEKGKESSVYNPFME